MKNAELSGFRVKTNRLLLLKESWASGKSMPVAFAVTFVVVTAMVIAIMVTTGRVVGAERQVLTTIDSAGTRTIVVRAEKNAGLTTAVLGRLNNIAGIAWIGAFGEAADTSNLHSPDGNRVATRSLYTTDMAQLGIRFPNEMFGDEVYLSELAMKRLGLLEGAGAVVDDAGRSYSVKGKLQTPAFLQELEPLALVPQAEITAEQEIAMLIVVADTPSLVASIGETVTSVLDVQDMSQVYIETSAAYAELRGIIEGQLATAGRTMVVFITLLSATLVSLLLFGLVMLRRKDYGRRRALGASQGLIIKLVTLQTLLPALGGAICGTLISLTLLIVWRDPLPDIMFCLAVIVLALCTAFVAAIVPALYAAHRQPLQELRVP